MNATTPVLLQSTTYDGTWFGTAPTLVGLLLTLFWGVMLLLKRPVERFGLRMLGALLLVVVLSILFGFNGEGGGFGAYVAEGLNRTMLSGLALFLLAVALLAATPVATEWFFVPLYGRIKARRGLEARPLRAQVGGYQVRGTFAHDVAEREADAAVLEKEPGKEDAGRTGDEEQDGADEPAGARFGFAVAPPDEEELLPPGSLHTAFEDETAPADEPPPTLSSPQAPSAAAEEAIPWYARRRRRRFVAEPEGADEPEADAEPEITVEAVEVGAVEEERAEDAADEERAGAEESEPEDEVFGDVDETFGACDDEAVAGGIDDVEVPDEETEASERSPSGEESATLFDEAAPEADPPASAEEAPPRAEREPEEAPPSSAADLPDPEDLLFDRAADLVVETRRASIAFLQRSLEVGYFPAARLLDRLEREGIIGPYTGAVQREVLMDREALEARRRGED